MTQAQEFRITIRLTTDPKILQKPLTEAAVKKLITKALWHGDKNVAALRITDVLEVTKK